MVSNIRRDLFKLSLKGSIPYGKAEKSIWVQCKTWNEQVCNSRLWAECDTVVAYFLIDILEFPSAHTLLGRDSKKTTLPVMFASCRQRNSKICVCIFWVSAEMAWSLRDVRLQLQGRYDFRSCLSQMSFHITAAERKFVWVCILHLRSVLTK